MVFPLIISTLTGLGVFFLGKFVGKRFNLSAYSYLGFAIISFVAVLAFHAEAQNKLLVFFSAYQYVNRSLIIWSVIGLCVISLLLIFFMEFKRNRLLGSLITTPQKPKRNRQLLERLEKLGDDPCFHPDLNFDKDSCVRWANKVEVLLKENSTQYNEWVVHRTTMLQTHNLFNEMGYLIDRMRNILDLAIKEIEEDINSPT